MIIYKNGNKTFIPVSMSFPKDEALKIANRHSNIRKDLLQVQRGYINGDELFIDKKGNCWVISRKEMS